MNHEMTIEESCLPSIKSGEYQVTAQVGDSVLGNSAISTEVFRVDGPRFSLCTDDVCSVFPGNGACGGFESTLPHVVLNRKTLPWERSISKQKENRFCLHDAPAPMKEIPWMCILLLQENEMVEVKKGIVGDVLKSDGDIFFPTLYTEDYEKESACSYIDIPLELFRNMAPSEDEMAFLVHARKKDATNGENDSWVSVVVGNRLPQSKDGSGAQNRAYLVSMEGFEGWEQGIGQNFNKVRLIVLYSWTFSSVKEKTHFYDVCEQLNADRLRINKAEISSDVDKIEDNGYVPLAHQFRQGSTSISFYRGPFCPATAQREQIKENWNPDSLYRYDPELGVFDVSYASAWQLGRLLSLENAKDKDIQKVRSECKKRIQKQQNNNILCKRGIHGEQADGDLVKWTLDSLREKKKELL